MEDVLDNSPTQRSHIFSNFNLWTFIYDSIYCFELFEELLDEERA